MTDWSRAYGPEGDAFPVAAGEVWRCGPHRIACLDLESPQAAAWADELRREGGCRLAFTDPPWSAGNARTFRTKALVDGARGRAVDFQRLIAGIFVQIVRVVQGGPIWVEMGNQAAPQVSEWLRNLRPAVQSWPVFYYRTHPCSLIRAAAAPYPHDREGIGNPSGGDEPAYTALAVAVDSSPGDRVYDPCTGRGLTATTAARAGRVFRGSELNPRRVSVTLARLAALGAGAPEREGVL